MLYPLSKITNPEHTSQFQLVKELDSKKVEEVSINKTKPVTLFDNLMTFRDTNIQYELKGDLLKKINDKNFNVDLANSSDRKLLFDFAKKK